MGWNANNESCLIDKIFQGVHVDEIKIKHRYYRCDICNTVSLAVTFAPQAHPHHRHRLDQ